jgi:hypothetical protein
METLSQDSSLPGRNSKAENTEYDAEWRSTILRYLFWHHTEKSSETSFWTLISIATSRLETTYMINASFLCQHYWKTEVTEYEVLYSLSIGNGKKVIINNELEETLK